jgi:hypothetical protein
MQIRIDLSGETALGALSEGITRRKRMNAAIGKRGEAELREHFRERNLEPNKRDWPKQEFWDRIRSATALSSYDDEGATITINDPAFPQKVYGGEIKPKEGKYLTLPAIAAAAGRSPRTFSNLEPMIRWMNGTRRAIALVERQATQLVYSRTRKDGTQVVKKGAQVGGTVFYWLVLSVRQQRDPRALPDRAKFERALHEEAGFFLEDLAR